MKSYPRIRKSIKWSNAAATVLLLVSATLTAGGCGGPKWTESSKTVDQSVFIDDLEFPRTFGAYWKYGGFYKGFHYLEWWSMHLTSWAEYDKSVRSQGEAVDQAVAAYLLKHPKQ